MQLSMSRDGGTPTPPLLGHASTTRAPPATLKRRASAISPEARLTRSRSGLPLRRSKSCLDLQLDADAPPREKGFWPRCFTTICGAFATRRQRESIEAISANCNPSNMPEALVFSAGRRPERSWGSVEKRRISLGKLPEGVSDEMDGVTLYLNARIGFHKYQWLSRAFNLITCI
jgi:hypothetical protein